MNVTPEMYSRMSRKASPVSRSSVNVPVAFAVGGAVCVLGQLIAELIETAGLDRGDSGTWASVILIGLSVLLTGSGVYHKIAKHAGAGTLVPITGFSNAVSSAAIEAKSEGFVLGVGTKIFTIAGPVLLYGGAASVIYGIIYYIIVRIS